MTEWTALVVYWEAEAERYQRRAKRLAVGAWASLAVTVAATIVGIWLDTVGSGLWHAKALMWVAAPALLATLACTAMAIEAEGRYFGADARASLYAKATLGGAS